MTDLTSVWGSMTRALMERDAGGPGKHLVVVTYFAGRLLDRPIARWMTDTDLATVGWRESKEGTCPS